MPRICPFCAGPMEPETLDRAIGGPLTLDLCSGCDGIWFDAGEQFRLTAESTLRLLKRVESRRGARRTAAGTKLPCPRCGLSLGITYDFSRDTRYRYYRCPDRHGVFFAYYDFLRSQGLIRGLTPEEIDALKRHAEIIHCPGCGAPVKVGTDAVCGHCGAPVSTIDLEYLRLALKQLEKDAAADAAPAGPKGPAYGTVSDPYIEQQYSLVQRGVAHNLVEAGLSLLSLFLK